MASEGSLKWFQIYIHKDRNLTEMWIKQAEKSGYKALVVTVDLPVLGQRLNDKRNKLTIPEDKGYAHFPTDLISNSTDDSAIAKHVNSFFDSSLTWSDLAWLASLTSLPIILKGILTSEDAKIALKYDCVKAIWVSNHGGRQLDGVSSTIEALPEVVKAVNGKLEVYIDGGVRQGTDVLKALALGAKAVLIGRPVLWGLAYDGEEGVKKVLNILNEELKTAMALSGCSSLSDISPELVVHESYYRKSNL